MYFYSHPTISGTFTCAAALGALLIAAPRVRADETQTHFDAGIKLYRDHKPDDALEEFNRALKTSPKDPNILRWIGYVDLERQNYEAARDPLERAVSIDPGSVVAHLNLGNVYDGLKMYPKARDEFHKVTRMKPDSPDGFFNLGLIESKTGRWPEAVEALRTAARLDAAMVRGSSGLREDPAMEDSLGYALLHTADTRGAIDAFKRAVALAPDNAGYNSNLGLAWRRLAEEKNGPPDVALANARRALKVAVDRTPGDYEFTEQYAEVMFEQGQNAEAIEQFSRAAELDKTQYRPVYNMALAQSRLGRYADAEKQYTRALTLLKQGDDPQFRRSAMNGLAISQFKQKKYDEAIATLKTYTNEYPTESDGWTNMAAAYRGKGDEAGQIEALRGAIGNSNGRSNAQFRTSLGALLYRRSDTSGALEQYTTANRMAPNNADTLNGLALTEQKLHRYDDAIRDFQAAVRANPRHADAYNNMGVAYESRYHKSNSKADLDSAVAAYRQALAIDPGHTLARRNKERLDKSAPN